MRGIRDAAPAAIGGAGRTLGPGRHPDGRSASRVPAPRIGEPRAQLLDRHVVPDFVDRVPEGMPGFPDRPVPKSDTAATTLDARAVTSLCDERPTWPAKARAAFDADVADVHGWGDDPRADRLAEAEIPIQPFNLKQSRT